MRTGREADESALPRVSMVICTRNRADRLRGVLESAAGMHIPEGLWWELIVVDNGSSDHTRAVIESFSDRLPIRYGSESEAGLSNARNRGAALAEGDYVCSTDDDVFLEPQWLASYAESFRAHPDGAFFGGPIELALPCDPPDWLERNWQSLAGTFGRREHGDEPIRLDSSRRLFPFGANFAVRASDLRRHRFDTRLGVSPTQRRASEETRLFGEIVLEGGKGYWVPGARIRHIIPENGVTPEEMFEFQRSMGETAAYLVGNAPRELAAFLVTAHNRVLLRSRLLTALTLAGTRLASSGLRAIGVPAWAVVWAKAGFYTGAQDFLRSDGLSAEQ